MPSRCPGRLATRSPADYNPDLAGALNNLSNGLAEVARPDEALTAIQDAVTIYRRLATTNPPPTNPTSRWR